VNPALAVAICVIGLGALAGVAAAGQASTVKLTAQLTAKQAAKLQSVKVTRPSGRFTGTLLRHSKGRSRLSWTLRYRHMRRRVTKAELVAPGKGYSGAVASSALPFVQGKRSQRRRSDLEASGEGATDPADVGDRLDEEESQGGIRGRTRTR
jgi:hypothetical protein